ncbi:MAG: type II secretion system F family protein [Betaproteobacteria bacterium]|nr:type II secretion system F family protein [Betaproteobacteria bacterium]
MANLITQTVDYLLQAGEDVLASFTPISAAARAFRPKRGEWYKYVANRLKLTDGLNLSRILENDVERYTGTPRGTLSAYWLERYIDKGANFAEAVRGTLPDEDVSLLAVAEANGHLGETLAELAVSTQKIEEAKKTFMSSIAAALAGAIVGVICIFAFSYGVIPLYVTNFKIIPPEKWGFVGKGAYAFANMVRAYGWIILLMMGGAGMWVTWSMRNYIGQWREWLDEKILFYRLYRDMQGPIFATQLAALLRRREGSGSTVMTLQVALRNIEAQSYPWLKWRIGQMLERADERPNDKMYILGVGLFDKEVMYLLADLVEVGDFERSMDVVAKESLSGIKETIPKRVRILKLSMMVFAIACGLGLYMVPTLMVNEFESALKRLYQ